MMENIPELDFRIPHEKLQRSELTPSGVYLKQHILYDVFSHTPECLPREGGGLRLLRESGGKTTSCASLRAATWIPAFAGKAFRGRKSFHKYYALFMFCTTRHRVDTHRSDSNQCIYKKKTYLTNKYL